MISRIIFLFILFFGVLKAQDLLFYDHFFRLLSFKVPQPLDSQKIGRIIDQIIQDDGIHEKRFQLWRAIFAAPRVRKELGNEISYPAFIRFCEKASRCIGVSSPIQSKEDFEECLAGLFGTDNLQDVKEMVDHFFQDDFEQTDSWIYPDHMTAYQTTDLSNIFLAIPKKQKKIVISNCRGESINQ